MKPLKDKVRLGHMLESAETAVQLASGRARADLDHDKAFELAMARLIEIMGEAANNVSVPLRDANPQIPWKQIIGARNELIHGYFTVDHGIVWEIIIDDLPVLIKNLKEILKGLA